MAASNGTAKKERETIEGIRSEIARIEGQADEILARQQHFLGNELQEMHYFWKDDLEVSRALSDVEDTARRYCKAVEVAAEEQTASLKNDLKRHKEPKLSQ